MSTHRQDHAVDESPSPPPPPNSPTRGQPPTDRVTPYGITRAIQATGMASAISSTTTSLMRALDAASRTKSGPATSSIPSSGLSYADQARSSETGKSSHSFGRNDEFGPPLPTHRNTGFVQGSSMGYHHDSATQGGNSPQSGKHQSQANRDSTGAEIRNILGQHANSGQQQSSYQKYVDAQKGLANLSLHGPPNQPSRQASSSLERSVHEIERYIYQRLLTISQNLEKLPGMPPDLATVLSTELYHIYEGYAAQSTKVNAEYTATEFQRDNLVRESAKLQGIATKYQQDSAKYRKMYQDAAAGRDQASSDKDKLRKQLNELSGKQLQLEQRLLNIEEKHAISLKGLQNELKFKDEQIMAKRTLWMNTRQDASRKSAEPIRDSFATPTKTSRISSYLPSAPAASSQQSWGPAAMSGSAPGSRAHYGSGSEHDGSPQMALIPFRNDMDVAEEFGAKFEKIYDLALKWTQKYTHELKTIEADQAMSRSEELWTFMKSCTFEDNKEAHAHVIRLLREAKARPFLVMRMIIQVLCNDIWTPSNFEDFDPSSKPKLDYFRARLQTRGLSPESRAKVISQQTDLIESMTQQQLPYLVFRNSQVGRHVRTLRARTGPLLDNDVLRADAGEGLKEIALQAFDLSMRMFTSNRTFLIKFPECGGKFLSTSMVSRNPYLAETPLENQIRQVRVKLAITPVVTMRDDRFMTIQVKGIQHSHVLIMI